MRLQSDTPVEWIEIVRADFDSFLIDHADCERKASSLAMAMAVRFSEKEKVVEPLLALASEELRHFAEVYQLMKTRGLHLKSNQKDPYVKKLVGAIRHSENEHFLDKLLVSGIIEARGYERFTMLANALEPGEVKNYYQRFANEEAGHSKIFDRLSRIYFEDSVVEARSKELFDFEAEVVKTLPLEARVH